MFLQVQAALRTIIDAPGGHRWELGFPDPHWHNQNDLIVLRTLLKQDRFVAAENSFDDVDDQAALDASPIASRLLDHMNGPWASDQFQHWCSGCCSSAEEARDKTYVFVRGVYFDGERDKNSLHGSLGDGRSLLF